MDSEQNPNIEILQRAVECLGPVVDQMVFLGGCATGLLITDPAAPPIRVTRDVDAIVQVVSRVEYYALSEKLRVQGFSEDMSDDAPICRWVSDNVMLDVMPTDERILGFGNQWYSAAMENAQITTLPNKKAIRIVTGPYFLMTKLEAFYGRGQGDYMMSHDIEDIIAVIDGRPGLAGEVEASDPVLREALSNNFDILLKDSRFTDAVSGHMPTDDISQARVTRIFDVLYKIVGNTKK